MPTMKLNSHGGTLQSAVSVRCCEVCPCSFCRQSKTAGSLVVWPSSDPSAHCAAEPKPDPTRPWCETASSVPLSFVHSA